MDAHLGQAASNHFFAELGGKGIFDYDHPGLKELLRPRSHAGTVRVSSMVRPVQRPLPDPMVRHTPSMTISGSFSARAPGPGVGLGVPAPGLIMTLLYSRAYFTLIQPTARLVRPHRSSGHCHRFDQGNWTRHGPRTRGGRRHRRGEQPQAGPMRRGCPGSHGLDGVPCFGLGLPCRRVGTDSSNSSRRCESGSAGSMFSSTTPASIPPIEAQQIWTSRSGGRYFR